MGGPAVISIHAWTESRDQHQTLLRELSIDEGEIEKFTAVQNYGLAMCIRRTLYHNIDILTMRNFTQYFQLIFQFHIFTMIVWRMERGG